MIAPVHQMMDGIGRNGHGSSSAWTAVSIMKSIIQKQGENSTHVDHDLRTTQVVECLNCRGQSLTIGGVLQLPP